MTHPTHTLSHGQIGLWLHYQQRAEGSEYNLPVEVRPAHLLEAPGIEKALQALVDRHPILRATYQFEDGEVIQRIHDDMQVSLNVVAVRDKARLSHRIREEANKPFNLETGPVFRAHLLSQGETEQVLLLNFHHIVADAYSIRTLLEEFGQLYIDTMSGVESALPEPGNTYADFAAWQRRLLDGSEGERLWKYWESQLESDKPPLELPTDRPRTAEATHTGSHHSFGIDPRMMDAVRQLAKHENVTTATVLLAAYCVLLHRYTEQDDVAVYFPRLGRPGESYDRTVGYFINMGVLRVDLSGNPAFSTVLKRVRQVMEGHRDHQHLPLPVLVERLRSKRALSHTQLAQVVFNYTPESMSFLGHDLCRVKLGPLDAKIRFCQTDVWVDLDFRVVDGSDETRCNFIYNDSLWDPDSIARLSSHYCRLLQSAVSQSQRCIGQFEIMAADEIQEMVIGWNKTDATYQGNICLHNLVEAQAERRPEAIAVSYDGDQLSYRELNRRSNQVAHYLKDAGLQPEDVVGVCLERSLNLIVGFLGILKAGGAYMPLDPKNPAKRLRFMLNEANASFLLTGGHKTNHICDASGTHAALADTEVRVICMDADAGAIALAPDGNPAGETTPRSLAYVMYTSGSTGKPKGVMVEHRSLCNMAEDLRLTYRLDPESKVLQFASSGFDASIFDTLLALTSGGQLCLAPPDASLPGEALVDFLERERITAAGLTPSALAMLPYRKLPDLQVIKSGGEALPAELVGLWGRGRRIINSYGPTEATVYAIRTNVADDAGKPMIGRPVINTKAYILDGNRQPVPIGVSGELYLGGVGLARGYLNDAALTADRFIEDPFDPAPDARLYRTGDRARFRADGVIEYLGRNDDQVKIRGMRVELGEIESMLSKHPSVSSCSVMLRDDLCDDSMLVAYIVKNEQGDGGNEDLRVFLRRNLPEHMVPSVYEVLPELPLNNSGKIDKRALPVPRRRAAGKVDEVSADQIATQIAAIWQDILGLDQVGLNENFFDVGGHSLAVMRVQSRLQNDLGITCKVVDLFQHPTIGSLAAHLGKTEATKSAVPQRIEAARDEPVRPAEDDHAAGIAIIGMAGRFPGADSVDQLWRNLLDGVESIVDLDDETLEDAGVERSLYESPEYVRREGLMNGVDLFDAAFFGISPRDAVWMDPQQRVLLETAWQALEHAGYGASRGRPHQTGVFAGVGASQYLPAGSGDPDELVSERLQQNILNSKDFTATRIAYKLNLKGPSLSVQTACSTSLVATHIACQNLRSGECDMALAGGASIAMPHGAGYHYQEGHIFSPDGHCRAFDAGAKGTVRGSGAGVVVLKRYADAIADGDFVWAVIKGSSINNDGAGKVGFTAPSVNGQAEVIDAALQNAGVDARTIEYIESHGTGTSLGDPIELAGLSEAFGGDNTEPGSCAIGSLKTNIGHLDVAAGVAGLIKATLTLHHKVIPPSLHFETPNPALDLDSSPFYVNRELSEWRRGDAPRRAGVSSFGIGGTNAHVVLEEVPQTLEKQSGQRHHLLPLSAATGSALSAAARNLAEHIRKTPDQSISDIAYTLQVGRSALEHRAVVVCDDREMAVTELEAMPVAIETSGDIDRGVVFMFSGQGAQHVGMGRDLYDHEKVFRESIDECAEILETVTKSDFRPLLYPDDASRSGDPEGFAAIVQPIFFSVQYAMTSLWRSWGIRPSAVIGHSIGEYAAAQAAGIISLEDALRLTLVRGELSRRAGRGSILAIAISRDELEQYLNSEISLAAVNGAAQCVVSGTQAAVSDLHERLLSEEVDCQLIPASHAGHSFMLDPILPEFTSHAMTVRHRVPEIPYVSTVTGTWLSDEEAVDPAYWARNFRQPVNFADGIENLLQRDSQAFVEIGPGAALAKAVRRHETTQAANHVAVATMPVSADPTNDRSFVLNSVGQLWASGLKIDWPLLHAGERRQRVDLPTYPFERKRYWIENTGRPVITAMPSAEVGSASAAAEPASQSPGPELNGGNGVEQQVVEIFKTVLGISNVAATNRFFDLGGDSLTALSVVNRIDRVFGRKLPVSALIEHQTPRNLAATIDEGKSTEPSELLVPIQPEGPNRPLFCPHPFGGNVLSYYPLASLLSKEQPVFGLQAQGLNGGTEPHSSLPDMATEYIAAMKAVQPAGPYNLVGHSMGGCIAWEIACQLHDSGERTDLLAMLDTKAGYKVDRSSDGEGRGPFDLGFCPGWVSEKALMLSSLFRDLSTIWGDLEDVPPDEQIATLFRIGGTRGFIPEMSLEQFTRIAVVSEANMYALENYSPRRYEGRSMVFVARQGLRLKAPDGPRDLGWARHSLERPQVIDVPGDHHSMMNLPHVSALAEGLRAYLPDGAAHHK